MNEATIRRELFHTLQYEGFWPLHLRDASICPRCGAKVLPTADRPDILAIDPMGQTIVVEVKFLRGTSFSFAEITPGQRTWLSMYSIYGGKAFLALGDDGRAPNRHLWLVPWEEWLDAEDIVRHVQNSLPLENPRRIEARERGLDAVTLFAPYSLLWIGGDQKWKLPRMTMSYQDPAEFREDWATMREAVESDWGEFYQYWRDAYES